MKPSFHPLTKPAGRVYNRFTDINIRRMTDMKRLASLLLALALCLLPLTTALAGDNYAGLAGGAVLRRGNRGEAVEKLQKALIRLGYLSGTADGVFGADTEEALALFQRKNGFGGHAGYSGVATLFTQAVLLGDENLPADAEGSITNLADGLYGLRGLDVRSQGGKLTSTFKFTNEGEKPIEAVCVIYWMADANQRIVNIHGENYISNVVYGLNLQPNATISIATDIPATDKELQRASSLRFIVAEISYVSGAVYVDYDASLAPYDGDYYLAAQWN